MTFGILHKYRILSAKVMPRQQGVRAGLRWRPRATGAAAECENNQADQEPLRGR